MLDLIKRGILACDAFGQQFNFRIHHRFTSYKTKTGFILTMLLILPILPFAVYKYNVMRYYDETNIIISTHYDYFNQDFILSSSDYGFTLAYAFIAFDEVDPLEFTS